MLCAIVDLTYSSNAFAVVVDLAQKKVIVDESFMGPPPPLTSVNTRPGEGLAARFRRFGRTFSARRPNGRQRYEVSVELSSLFPVPRAQLSFSGELLAAGGAPPLTVVAPVEDGGFVNVTQKWAGMLAFGALTAGGRRYLLDGGVGGIDYTHGLLARRTAWRWAFVNGRLPDGTPLGINLVEGFNESNTSANENAVWLGKRLQPVGRAHFRYNPNDPLDEWKVETADGAVNLLFRPIAVHRENRDLKLVRSDFLQPVGLFSGTVRVDGRVHELTDVPGVTEHQDVLW